MTAPSRRERLRAETIGEIKAAALEQIAAEGAGALSIRGVARAIGMSPAGLYRYYDGRDALLTELITDAYNDLADVVADATAADGRRTWERFAAGIHAYRAWAVAEPNRFLLIFGTPVPGYAAPEGGPTVAANRRMGEAFFQLAAEAWNAGEIATPTPAPGLTESELELSTEIATAAPGFPPSLLRQLMAAWGHWHGVVILEITHQLHWLYGVDAEPVVEASVEQILNSLGARI